MKIEEEYKKNNEKILMKQQKFIHIWKNNQIWKIGYMNKKNLIQNILYYDC